MKLLEKEKDKVVDKNKQLKDEKDDIQKKTHRGRKIIDCLRKNTAKSHFVSQLGHFLALVVPNSSNWMGITYLNYAIRHRLYLLKLLASQIGKQNYQDKDTCTPSQVLRKHVTMFQQMHIITGKVSNKYIKNIRKEDIFPPLVGMSETFKKVIITYFHRLHFPLKTLGTFFSQWCTSCWRHKEIMSCIWSSFP